MKQIKITQDEKGIRFSTDFELVETLGFLRLFEQRISLKILQGIDEQEGKTKKKLRKL